MPDRGSGPPRPARAVRMVSRLRGDLGEGERRAPSPDAEVAAMRPGFASGAPAAFRAAARRRGRPAARGRRELEEICRSAAKTFACRALPLSTAVRRAPRAVISGVTSRNCATSSRQNIQAKWRTSGVAASGCRRRRGSRAYPPPAYGPLEFALSLTYSKVPFGLRGTGLAARAARGRLQQSPVPPAIASSTFESSWPLGYSLGNYASSISSSQTPETRHSDPASLSATQNQLAPGLPPTERRAKSPTRKASRLSNGFSTTFESSNRRTEVPAYSVYGRSAGIQLQSASVGPT